MVIYCGHSRVVFIATRDDYARYYVDDREYFTFATFYDKTGKPLNAGYRQFASSPEGVKVYETSKGSPGRSANRIDGRVRRA